jgi:sugar phosphate isomerase/epimerase
VRLGAYLPEAFQRALELRGKGEYEDPWDWASSHAEHVFSAAGVVLLGAVPDDLAAAYVTAAESFNLQISEVPAFGNNPISKDDQEAKRGREQCQQQLALAERLGARCCVNIAGSLGDRQDGPFEDDLAEETFALIVDSVREIIDAVRPTRTFYTLETMPWLFPDSVDSYERLLRAVDRDAFGVHFDPVNLVSSPRLYFQNGDLIREFVRRLGDRIRSCHAKDIRLGEQLTVHLDEVRPGTGALDYPTFVTAVEAVDPEIPLLVEHLDSTVECLQATDYIRSACRDAGVDVIEPDTERTWARQ